MSHNGCRLVVGCLPLILLFSGNLADGQRSQKEFVITLPAAEVMVDVIASDKRNRIIPDLAADDFEIYEDGIRQEVRWIRLVKSVDSRGAGQAGEEAGTPPRSPATAGSIIVSRRTPDLIALVFDHLSMTPQSRAHARQAAQEYIETMGPNDFVALFGVDEQMFMAMPFTSDRTALKGALERMGKSATNRFVSRAADIESLLGSDGRVRRGLTDWGFDPATLLPLKGIDAVGPGKDEQREQGGPPPPGGITEDLVARLQGGNISGGAILLKMFRSFERFDQSVQARSVILGLLSIVQGQQLIPGRKTLILFSEGFALPGETSPQFQSVIGAANRSNVAVYTVDAAGLRAESETSRVNRELDAVAMARRKGADPSLVQGGESMLGRSERLVRSSQDSVLDELAQSTGGLAIKNTNDLRAGLDRIKEDMGAYYLLSYEPVNQDFDGRYRTIEVRVSRPEVTVRAREGYYALRTEDGEPIFDFERPLLASVYDESPPHDFPVNVSALHFPDPAGDALFSLVAQIPADGITFNEMSHDDPGQKKKQSERKRYEGALDVMALVRNAQGMVSRKLSRNYRLSFSPDQMKSIRGSNFVFRRLVPLAPGTYTIDLAAKDGTSTRTSVNRTRLRVPAHPSPALRISSIMTCKGGDPPDPDDSEDSNPLYFNGVIVMPKFDGTFSKTADKEVMFYFTVQTSPGATVRASLQFLREGRIVAEAPGALPAPDQRGRIKFATAFPVIALAETTYDVRVSVSDGEHEAGEETSFRVVP